MTGSNDNADPAADEATGPSRHEDPDMREEIVRILLEALRKQGHPEADAQAVRQNPDVRQAFLALLDDCRPLPVVQRLRDDVAFGRF